jgi:hypothetical protein
VATVAPATAIARPYGFLATPTDQLAVPGYVAGFEITPEGFVYGGHGELVLRAGLVGLRAPVRTLEGGRYPLMRYGQTFAGVRYGLEVFASIVAASPSRSSASSCTTTRRIRCRRAGRSGCATPAVR